MDDLRKFQPFRFNRLIVPAFELSREIECTSGIPTLDAFPCFEIFNPRMFVERSHPVTLDLKPIQRTCEVASYHEKFTRSLAVFAAAVAVKRKHSD